MTVEYLLSDHLGSTSITTNNTGAKVSEMRYREESLWDKPWGEVRYSWTATQSTTPAYRLAKYTYTGQYSYMDDPSTTTVTEGFGLMFYNARMYDPALGRFTSADTIIPGGAQGLDRYAYVNNSPVNFTDPSGHKCSDGQEECQDTDGKPINGAGGLTTSSNGDNGDEGDSLEETLVHDFFYNPILGGSSSGCNTWILWNGSSFCHQNTYEQRLICLAIFNCSPEKQLDYATRFQYPGQDPRNPIDPNADRTDGYVVGGDFMSDDSYLEHKWRQLGAVWVETHGSTMTNYTYKTHIFYEGQIDRTISNGYVKTSGQGTNTALWVAIANQYGGPVAFQANDDAMLVFSTLDQLSGGALLASMKPTP